jgi:hypothetical protein
MKNEETKAACGQLGLQNFRLACVAALAVALLGLTACSSTPPEYPDNTSPNSGQGGDVTTSASTRTATVVSVDRVKRLVVLRREDGTDVTYKALPNAFAFGDVKAGDVVKISVSEEMAFYIGKGNIAPSFGANTATLHARVPGSTQALVAQVGTLVYNGKIINVDDWNNAVTIKAKDGSTRTIQVGESVNLADVSVGDHVSVQATEATLLLLEKP